MKELMMDEQEIQEEDLFDLEVGFLCPECGHPAAAYVATPADESENAEEVSCLNPEADHRWMVRVSKRHFQLSARLAEHPDVSVSLLPAGMPDDWDEPLPEPGAYGIFLGAMEEWRYHLDEIATYNGDSSRNRMLFSTLFSIVEAYFSDTIIGAALVDASVQRQMLKLDALKDKQITLETVLDKPNIVRDMVKEALQGLSFHNLPMVNWICESAFGKPILPRDKEDRTLIVKSVNKRHDCVHRNGFDKDGNKHTDITPDYLRKLGTIFEGMAQALESAMQDAKVRQFIEDLGPGEDTQVAATGGGSRAV